MHTPKHVADLNFSHFFHHFLPHFLHPCKSPVCAVGLVLVRGVEAVEKIVELATVVGIDDVAQFVKNHVLLKFQRHLRQRLAQTDFCRSASIAKPPSFLVLADAHYWVRYMWKFCRKLIPAILEHGVKYLIFRFVCFHRCDSLSHLMCFCSFVILNALSILFTAFTVSAIISSRLLTTSIER